MQLRLPSILSTAASIALLSMAGVQFAQAQQTPAEIEAAKKKAQQPNPNANQPPPRGNQPPPPPRANQTPPPPKRIQEGQPKVIPPQQQPRQKTQQVNPIVKEQPKQPAENIPPKRERIPPRVVNPTPEKNNPAQPSILKRPPVLEKKQADPVVPPKTDPRNANPGVPVIPKTTEGRPFVPGKGTGTPPNNNNIPVIPKATEGRPFVPGKGPAVVTPPPKFTDVQAQRKQTTIAGGAKIIREPGNRTIIQQNNKIVIRSDDNNRFRAVGGNFAGGNFNQRRLPNGLTQSIVVRPGGISLVSEYDRNNRLVRRFRRDGGGREVYFIDNRRFYRNAAFIGVGALALGLIALNLRPPVISIPRERYIVDYDRASDDDLYEALYAPPVERLERAYSLDEVRSNVELRDRMRSVDLDSINFEFGAFEVSPDQFNKLERVAKAILRVLERNPETVFMIEGHTDAVGSDVDNLSLSDRRAESVAQVLSSNFGIPPENLVTQGYGKQFLKIQTDGPERRNRRVVARNVGPLMTGKSDQPQ